MAGPDFVVALADLDKALSSIEAVVGPDRKRAEIAELELQASAPDLWDNPDNAQKVTSRLSALQAEVDRLVGMRSQLEDIGVLDAAARLDLRDRNRVQHCHSQPPANPVEG